MSIGFVQLHVEVILIAKRIEPLQIIDGHGRSEVLLVRLWERVGISSRDAQVEFVAEPGGECVGEVVLPRSRGGDEAALELVAVDLDRAAAADPDDEMDPREHRFGDPERVVDAQPTQRLEQDRAHLQPHLQCRSVRAAGRRDTKRNARRRRAA